jgi:anti-sigma factor RsiW
MNQTQDSADLIERYLLGELSETERTALENEYLVDRAGYDQICRIEDDLLDRYARGALSPVDRERVERRYKTNPWRRRHLDFAEDLVRVIDEELAAASNPKQAKGVSWRSIFAAPPHNLRAILRPMPAIAALLVVIGGTWFTIETARLRAWLGEARREAEALRRRERSQARQITDLDAQLRQLAEERDRLQTQLRGVKKTGPPLSRIGRSPVFLTISVEDFRGAGAQEPKTLTIPRGATEARLRLYPPGNAFPAYLVTLRREAGSEVFSRSGLRPHAGKAGDFVIVNLPASRLTNGNNVLALSGISPAGEVEPLAKTLIKVRMR